MIARIAGALLLLGALSPRSAEALTWKEPLTLQQMAERAPLSFQGTVVAITHRSVPIGEKRLPYTEVAFHVDDAYAGTRDGDTVRLRQVGGPLPDGRTMVIPGLPEYEIGDHVVVFADPKRQPVAGAIRGADSVYRVVESERGQALCSHQGTWLMPIGDFEALLDGLALPTEPVAAIGQVAYEADLSSRFGGE